MKKLLSLGVTLLLLAGQGSVKADMITFDELPFQPVDGITFNGVTFGFTIGGLPSPDANYASGGPGIITYVSDPSLEGNSSGILTLDFATPTANVQFGLAL